MNPKSGLKIHAFKAAHTAEAQSDRELYRVGKYMTFIATTAEDFTSLNHHVRTLVSFAVWRELTVYRSGNE